MYNAFLGKDRSCQGKICFRFKLFKKQTKRRGRGKHMPMKNWLMVELCKNRQWRLVPIWNRGSEKVQFAQEWTKKLY